MLQNNINKISILALPETDKNIIKYGFNITPDYLFSEIENNGIYLEKEGAEQCFVLHPLICFIYKRQKDKLYAIKNNNKTYSLLFPDHIYNIGYYDNIIKHYIDYRLNDMKHNICEITFLGSLYYPELSIKHTMLLYEIIYQKQKHINNESNLLYLSENELFEKYMSFDKYSRKYIDVLYERRDG